MKNANVSLTEGWQATPTWVSKEGFISTVRLEHLPTGRIVDRTRFDSGKLLFLDRRDEFPSFEREVLMGLAMLLGHVQEVLHRAAPLETTLEDSSGNQFFV